MLLYWALYVGYGGVGYGYGYGYGCWVRVFGTGTVVGCGCSVRVLGILLLYGIIRYTVVGDGTGVLGTFVSAGTGVGYMFGCGYWCCVRVLGRGVFVLSAGACTG